MPNPTDSGGPGPQAARADAWFWGLLGLCALVGALPFWVPDYLPLQDVGANLTYAVILHHHGAAGHPYTELYAAGSVFLPNGLVLFTIAWLGHLMPFLTAVRLVLSAQALLLPLAFLALLRASGRSRWWVFFAVLLVFHYPLACGYLPFATAVPVLVYALALTLRQAAAPSLARGASLAVVAALVFWGHAQAYMYLGYFALVMLLVCARSLRQAVVLAAPFVPSLALALPWIVTQVTADSQGVQLGMVAGGGLGARWLGPLEVLGRLPGWTVQRFAGPHDEILFALIVTSALLAAGLGLVRWRRTRPPTRLVPDPGQERAARLPAVLAIAALVACFAFPYLLRIHTGLNSRMVPVLWLLLVAAGCGYRLPRLGRVAVGLWIAAGLLFHLGVAERYGRFQADEVGGLVEMIDRLPDHSRLAYLPLAGGSQIVHTGAGVFWHVAGYHFALNEGVAFSHFHRYRGRHAEYRSGRALPEPTPPVSRFLDSPEAREYGYLLLRTARPLTRPPDDPRLELLGLSGQFSLWRLHLAPTP